MCGSVKYFVLARALSANAASTWKARSPRVCPLPSRNTCHPPFPPASHSPRDLLNSLSVRSRSRCPRVFGVPASGSSALREPSGFSARGGGGGCARVGARVRLHGRGGGAARVPVARLQVCRRFLLAIGMRGRQGRGYKYVCCFCILKRTGKSTSSPFYRRKKWTHTIIQSTLPPPKKTGYSSKGVRRTTLPHIFIYFLFVSVLFCFFFSRSLIVLFNSFASLSFPLRLYVLYVRVTLFSLGVDLTSFASIRCVSFNFTLLDLDSFCFSCVVPLD